MRLPLIVAGQVRQTLAFWAIDTRECRSLTFDEIPDGALVLRASAVDRRLTLPADVARSRVDRHVRSVLGAPAAVLSGAGRLVYAVTRGDEWFPARGLRVAPLALLLDEAVREQKLTPPVVLGLHLPGSVEGLLLWSIGHTGELSEPLLVLDPPADEAALAARVFDYARQSNVPGDKTPAILDAADLLPLARRAGRRLRAYPLADEWLGQPKLRWAALAAGLSGLTLATVAGTWFWFTAGNARLAADLVRARDRSAIVADTQRLVRAHAVAYAGLDSVDFRMGLTAAQAVWQPGLQISLFQRAAAARVRVQLRQPGDEEQAIDQAQRLAALLDAPPPAGFSVAETRIAGGGELVEVEYAH